MKNEKKENIGEKTKNGRTSKRNASCDCLLRLLRHHARHTRPSPRLWAFRTRHVQCRMRIRSQDGVLRVIMAGPPRVHRASAVRRGSFTQFPADMGHAWHAMGMRDRALRAAAGAPGRRADRPCLTVSHGHFRHVHQGTISTIAPPFCLMRARPWACSSSEAAMQPPSSSRAW